MNVHTENLPDCRVKIALQFEPNDVDAAFKRVYTDLNRQGSVPGFRPGKTPRALLVRHFGADMIKDMAKSELLSDPVQEVLEGLDLVTDPEFPDLQETDVSEGEPLEVVVLATVGPRVTVGDLSGLKLTRPAPEGSEEEVVEVLEDLRRTHADRVKPDRDAVKEGDDVDLELEITLEGEDEVIDEVEQTIVAGEKDQFPPISEKLPGRIVGQAVELEATYPEDYHDDSLAGKTAMIRATIKGIEERVLPELNDDFATRVDEEKFDSLDDLRAEIKRQLDGERSRFSRSELEDQISEALLEHCQVELPDVMVQNVAAEEMRKLQEAMESGNLPEDFEAPDEETITTRVTERARRMLTLHAILDELVKQQAPSAEHGEEDAEAEVDPDEFERALAAYAHAEDIDPGFLAQAAMIQPEIRERVLRHLHRSRAFDAIIAQADLEDMAVEDYLKMRFEEAEKQEEPDDEEQGDETGAAEQVDEPETEAPAEPAEVEKSE